MAVPAIEINLGNGSLGFVPQTTDAVVGMILNGVSATSVPLLTAKQVYSLPEVEALGINAAYDTTNNVKVWLHFKEFYDEAGKGSELWFMLCSQAVSLATMCDNAQNFAKKLLDEAQGRIKVLGVVRNPAAAYVPTTTNQIDIDVENALVIGQVLGDAFAAKFTPVRIVLDGFGFTGNATGLVDLRTKTSNRVGVLVGGSVQSKNSIGLLLGRVAKIPVQRNIGRMQDKVLPILSAFVGAGKVTDATATLLHDRGFMSMRPFPRKSGFYFISDPMATAATDDYKSLSLGRVIDKAISIAYDVYVEQLNSEVLLNSAGKMSVAQAKYFELLIENAINFTMTNSEEISAVKATIDTNQNVLQTGKVCIDLQIQPTVVLSFICVNLGFTSSIA